jgi:hypothetical protein
MNLGENYENILLQKCYTMFPTRSQSEASACLRKAILQTTSDRPLNQIGRLDFLAHRFALREQVQIIRAAGF